MRYVPASLRSLIVRRAGNRCEYCGLSQIGQAATFHVDHIVPVVEGGQTTADNLALACVSCSLRKAARLRVPDPDSDEQVNIYNPRREVWGEHFRWEGVRIIGFTATGRATVAALKMNRPIMLAIRAEEMSLDRHPPP